MKKQCFFVLFLLFSTLVFLLGGCSDSGSNGQTPGDGDSEEEITLPKLVRDCSLCHNYDDLSAEHSNEDAGPKEWLAENGLGLVRFEKALPEPGLQQLASPWPDRGRHSESDLADCFSCHPVDELGHGHGIKTFSESARSSVFQGETNCAGACHAWLKDSVTTEGFENAQGETASYSGSIRPEDLLSVGNSMHRTIWKEGYYIPNESIKIAMFHPGCGGCHQVAEESHGTIPECLQCHNFQGSTGELHTKHMQAIQNHVDANDPEGAQLTGCIYCHRADGVDNERPNAACRNCHLSGHQPLDENGNAHFWPIEN